MTTSVYELLADHPFLAGMSPDQVDRLSHRARRTAVAAGTRLFSEGGDAGRFWLIRDGEVALDTRIPGRGTVVIDTVGPDAVLGWSWLCPPYRWHFGATALAPTVAVELDSEGVAQLCAEDPAIGYELHRRFVEVVVDRLQATRIRLLDLYADRPREALT